MLEKEKSVERTFIHPLPKDAAKLKKEHKPFSYTIARELLEKHYGAAGAQPSPAIQKGIPDEYRTLLERINMSLTDQLKVKDEQIRVLAQAIDDLSERQRETNILMKGLQERLLLAAPQPDIVEATPGPSNPKKSKKRWWRLWHS